jgi:serine/threonine protein phosphatase 1
MENLMNDFLQDNPFVIHHETNLQGRDLIIGDLHGCRSMLDTLLAHVGFDGSRDRLFSVGDLVDRGPDSEGCLNLVGEQWFFPVLGNHEAMLLAFLMQPSIFNFRQWFYKNAFENNSGTNWAYTLENLDAHIEKLKNIPFVRVVGEGAHRFQVLHAERRDNETRTFLSDADLDAISEKKISKQHWIVGMDDAGDWLDHLLLGRSYIQTLRPYRFPKLETLDFTGHTPAIFAKFPNAIIQIGMQVYLDSGAFAASKESIAGLTLWDVQNRQGWRLLGNGEILDCQLMTGE